MPTSTEAEENLRVIRSLMEKATIYRAISAPTALVGGIASTLFGGWLYFQSRSLPADLAGTAFGTCFVVGWLAVLAITMIANFGLIWRAAVKRQERFISPAMRKALWALLPPMLCGGCFTAVLTVEPAHWLLPQFWMIFYGLGLLATAQFSPRAISILGWCFLFAGLASFGIQYGTVREIWRDATVANGLMVATFGLFHLIYAACTWPRRGAETEP